jgi:hypothetical protein
MDTNSLMIIGIAAFVVVAMMLVIKVTQRGRRTKGLKEQFGPEYDHAVAEYGTSKKAEAELKARQKRVEGFDLHQLAEDERVRFAAEWKQTQGEFVDEPDKAVLAADSLVQRVMLKRGYPVGDFEQRTADISVDRPMVVTNYRTAHEIALKQEKGKATTEDLRQAMIHYRSLFDDMLKVDATEETNKGNGKTDEGKALKDNGRSNEEKIIKDNEKNREKYTKEHA